MHFDQPKIRNIAFCTSNNKCVLALTLAILLRCFFEYLIPDLPTDKIYQITSAHQLVKGNAISLAFADANDLSKTVYERIGLWPPGYALLISPFLALGWNWVSSSIALDFIGIIIFFISWKFIFRLIKDDIPSYLPGIVFLYWGLTISPFRHLYSTDLLALSFFCLGFWALIFAIKKSTQLTIPHIIFISFAFFSCSLFHYGYYLVSATFPLIITFYAYKTNHKSIKAALFIILGTFAFITLQVVYLKFFVGDSYYLNDYHPAPFKDLHLENLQRFDSFVFNSFFDFLIVQKFLSTVLSTWANYLLSFAVGALLFVFVISSLLLRKISMWGIKEWLILSGFILIVSKIGLLILLSLRYPAENNNWTYVYETRYFSVALLFIPLFLFLSYSNIKSLSVRILTTSILTAGVIFSIGISVYQLNKYSPFSPAENMFRYFHYNKEVYNFIKSRNLKVEDESLLICDAQSNNYIYDLFSIEGFRMIKFQKLPVVINTSSDVKMLLISDKSSPPEIELILNKYTSRKVFELKDGKPVVWEILIPKNN